MFRRLILTVIFSLIFSFSMFAQGVSDVVLVLPFENTSGKGEFNWVGESFADSLSDLLRVPTLNVVSNEQRKVIQQRLRIPLTTLPTAVCHGQACIKGTRIPVHQIVGMLA